MTFMCEKRYSDSEIYKKPYRSLKYTEDSQAACVYDSEGNIRLNRSISTIFPPAVKVSYIPL